MTDNYWQNLARQVDDQQKVGRENLAIWGGQCEEDTILDLLNKWSRVIDMPYRIWEYSSEITFEKDELPEVVDWLERGRLFGKAGDLSLRRDGGIFRWRFIGPSGTEPPEEFSSNEEFVIKNFWDFEPEASFYENQTTSLLWGECSDEELDGGNYQWFEDRVAGANLNYPVVGKPDRVQIVYNTYSRAGRVEFVWLHEVSEWREQTND